METTIKEAIQAEANHWGSQHGLTTRDVKVWLDRRVPEASGWRAHYTVLVGFANDQPDAHDLIQRLLTLGFDTDNGERGYNLRFDGSQLMADQGKGLVLEEILVSALVGPVITEGAVPLLERPEDWHDK